MKDFIWLEGLHFSLVFISYLFINIFLMTMLDMKLC